ncbi:hypothetical protein NDU88_003328 [Pleurodeles waltl]|uniref:Uncharacterized protein n=1 Tax=Pleurodeles waltl TaxID=8319 RepID=A0AAV7KW89_PLEWA|nr:hypothetical protein NDU88_003328 [Pleurodeles waltl]
MLWLARVSYAAGECLEWNVGTDWGRQLEYGRTGGVAYDSQPRPPRDPQSSSSLLTNNHSTEILIRLTSSQSIHMDFGVRLSTLVSYFGVLLCSCCVRRCSIVGFICVRVPFLALHCRTTASMVMSE